MSSRAWRGAHRQVAVLLLAAGVLGVLGAQAQSGPPGPAPPPGPPGAQPGGRPPRIHGPPTWDRQQLEELRRRIAEARRQRDERAARSAPSPEPEPTAQCHRDPGARPPDINLVHGFLGVDDDKAPPPPPLPKGTWEWWKWRLTPSLWRYENHKLACDPRSEAPPLGASIINVAVLGYLLVRFGRRPLAAALEKRRQSIIAEIERARAVKEQAAKRLEDYNDRLDHLDEKLEELRARYQADHEADTERLVREMGEQRHRLLVDAQFLLAQETKAARDDLSHEALREALAAAQDLLLHQVTPRDHERIAEQYLDLVGPALRAPSRDTRGGP
ncbi:MAG: hypothetical protein HY744_11435 [Deltaproteobacteria bacterium]|nr:hypothetical protein [Deltaproteobacteria bacterium]